MTKSRRVVSARHPRGRTAAGVLAAAAVTAGAVGCTSSGQAAQTVAHTAAPQTAARAAAAQATAHAGAVQGSIVWGACPAPPADVKRDPRLTCGSVRVPLDYRHPDGKTITIEVSRIATAKPGKRRGFLLFSPGGPGLPGLDMPGQMAPTLPSSVLDEYDLIGFDPRGVGRSSPVSCGLSDPSFPFPYPAADGSIAGDVATARAIARQCATVGDTLRFFTTANTARDIDRIRQALGVAKISYWGQSFGTYIGAVYTALFPQHTDRMVLEGNVDPAKAWAGQVRLWGKGMADRFPDAARIAAADDTDLKLGRTVEQVTKSYLALADHLDREPAAVPGTPISISGPLLRAVTYQLLLHNDTLTRLTQFWKAAADLAAGQAPTATDTAVLQKTFGDDSSEPGVPADNQTTVGMAMLCGDATWPHDLARYAAATRVDRRRWPLTAGMPANVWPCVFWSHRPVEPRVKVTSRGPRNVLILQNRRDNATPWEGALGMRRALGSRAGFVGADNGGHYVYHTGSTCADQATIAFLTNGTLPGRDLYCPGPRH